MKKIETVEDVRHAMKLSAGFDHVVWNCLREDLLDQQANYFEDVNPKGLTYHDHYYSFFYTINDRDAFLNSLIKSNLYDTREAEEKMNELLTVEFDSVEYDAIDEWLDKKAEELLALFEKDLHSYENPDRVWEDDVLDIQLEAGLYDNYYIRGNEVVKYHPPVKEYYETI